MTFYPDGSAGASQGVQSGTLKVISVTATALLFDYTFVATDGTARSGTATLGICPSAGFCG